MDVAPSPPLLGSVADPDDLIDESIRLVERWLEHATHLETASTRRTMERLRGVVVDEAGVNFVMAFIDRVARPDDDAVASCVR